jgi:hypothetical protein
MLVRSGFSQLPERLAVAGHLDGRLACPVPRGDRVDAETGRSAGRPRKVIVDVLRCPAWLVGQPAGVVWDGPAAIRRAGALGCQAAGGAGVPGAAGVGGREDW